MLVLLGTVAISAFIGSVVGIELLNLEFADNLTAPTGAGAGAGTGGGAGGPPVFGGAPTN